MKLLGVGSIVKGSAVVEFIANKNRDGNVYLVRLEDGRLLSLKEIEAVLGLTNQ